MKNLKEFSEEYFEKKKKHMAARKKLQKQIEKVHSKLGRLKKPTLKEVIEPLAVAIQKELKAKAYYVIDIDSIMSTVKIYWGSEPDMYKCENKDEIAMLEIDRSDEQFVIIERDEDDKRQYECIRAHGGKGIKWLAKYAKQNLKNSRKYNGN